MVRYDVDACCRLTVIIVAAASGTRLQLLQLQPPLLLLLSPLLPLLLLLAMLVLSQSRGQLMLPMVQRPVIGGALVTAVRVLDGSFFDLLARVCIRLAICVLSLIHI